MTVRSESRVRLRVYRGQSRLLALVVAFGLAPAVGILAPAPAAAEPGRPQASQPTGAASALAMAAASGERVEILSQRSERTRVWADPAGTMTLESYVVPRWTRRVSDGGWTDIDTRLRTVDDGWAPAATLADVRFSAGGTGPFVTLHRQGHTFALSWPEPLPTPTVDGSALTYAEVRPGVDLVARATATGFSHVLVVKTAAAAADTRVRQVRLDIGGDVTVSTTAEDGLRVTAGPTLVATAGGASMWDSRTPPTAKTMTEPAAGGSSPAGPADAARTAEVDLAITNGDLVLTPNPDLLAGGTFPVFIDPDFSTAENAFAYANSTNTNWTLTDPNPRSGDVGGNQLWAGLDPNSGRNYRGFLQFPMVANYDLRGKRILAGKVQGVVDHTWKCGYDREMKLYRTAGISTTPRQAWPGPALHVGLGSWWSHANEDSCTEGNQYKEVSITSDLQAVATANWTNYTLGIVAAAESSTEHWFRMFLDSFYLTATFNTPPAVPTNLSVDNTPCGTSAVFTPSTTPKLQSRIFDADGDTDLTVQYTWDRWNSTSTAWEHAGATAVPGQRSGTDPVLRLGVDVGTALTAGRYRWTASVVDPFPGGNDASAWAPWCEFELDLLDPTSAPGVSSTTYPEYLPEVDEDYHGGVGQTGPFTFTPGSDTDIASYKWGWSDPPTTVVPAQSLGGPATANLTPPPPFPNSPARKGTLTLHVRSVDRAGREGPIRIYQIRVGPAPAPIGTWNLADPPGASPSNPLADTSATPHPGTPTSITTGQPGRLLSGPTQSAPTAASFNGTSSSATTGTPILDTSKSFTVSAWVNLANTNYYAAAIGQDGPQYAAFSLQYSQDVNRYSMTAVASNGAVTRGPIAPTAPRLNVWTHLIGVYDAGPGQLLLYVDGKLAGAVPYRADWTATGGLTIGRTKYNTELAFWPGKLAEINTWQRVVSAEEAATMAATQIGAWALDGNGADATEEPAWGRTLTTAPLPAAPVTWGPGHTDDAAVFPGTTAALTSAGPAVRTDQSFTVTGWIRMATNTKSMAMISQDSTDAASASGFVIGYEPNPNRLAFVMYANNQANPGYSATWSTSAPIVGDWIHIAAVYDATTGQMRLYINGALTDTEGHTTAWHAAGPLILGRFRHNGNPMNYYAGDIDDVRIYGGALPDTEIAKLHQP